MDLFAMVAAGKPFSQQSGRSKRDGAYQSWLKRVARQYVRDVPVFGDVDLYLRVVWFHTYPVREPDADNIIKPVSDALEGIAFREDRAIIQCLSERVFVPAGGTISVSAGGVPPKVYQDLLTLLSGGHSDFLFVEIGPAAIRGVALGVPIGGIP